MNSYFHRLLFNIQSELNGHIRGANQLKERIEFFETTKDQYKTRDIKHLKSVVQSCRENMENHNKLAAEIKVVLDKLKMLNR